MIQLVTYLVLMICAKMTINLSKLILKGIEYHHPEFYSITGIVSPNQKSLL